MQRTHAFSIIEHHSSASEGFALVDTPYKHMCRMLIYALSPSRGLIDRAQAGSGEVARIIAASTFRPREPAYTKLLQQCKHSHSWEKAVELWDVMRATPELKPNTISYRSARP